MLTSSTIFFLIKTIGKGQGILIATELISHYKRKTRLIATGRSTPALRLPGTVEAGSAIPVSNRPLEIRPGQNNCWTQAEDARGSGLAGPRLWSLAYRVAATKNHCCRSSVPVVALTNFSSLMTVKLLQRGLATFYFQKQRFMSAVSLISKSLTNDVK